MSTWLFDLGNSRLKCAPLAGERAGPVTAVAHDGTAFAAGWQAALPAACTRACIASVAPDALLAQLTVHLAGTGARVERVRTEATRAGVRIAYADPARLGVDRFLALLAAHAQGDGDALVVGVGTALTVDLLARDGRHLGGRIAPSPMLMREALHARASHLPATGGSYAAFAIDTADALASGCEGAALALVERSMQEAGHLLGNAPALLVHGGGAPALLPRLPGARDAPALVLDGLARWAARPG
jgi:type III pantothenate kinase